MSKSMVDIKVNLKNDTPNHEKAPRKVSLTEGSTELDSVAKGENQFDSNSVKDGDSSGQDASIQARLSSRDASYNEIEQDVFVYEHSADRGSFVFSGCKILDSDRGHQLDGSMDIFYEKNRNEMSSLCRGMKYE